MPSYCWWQPMDECELLGAKAYGKACGMARLKADATDFLVDELLPVEPAGQGEHLWLRIEKRELNSEEVAKRLARVAGIPLRAVGYAGLKDRFAVTRQWFSLHLPGRADPDLAALIDDRLHILCSDRHTRKLQRGAHAKNGFRIRLTDWQGDSALMDERLQQIRQNGVPNYFGPQRFGFAGGNLVQAQQAASANIRPKQRDHRSRLFSTARSYLFNQVLSARIEDGVWNKALPGDLLAFTSSRSFFLAGEADCSDERLALLDLHPTGPLMGINDQQELAGYAQALEARIAKQFSSLTQWLSDSGVQAARRILRLPVEGLSWHYDEIQTLELSFNLPAGCFATAVVRELVDLTPASDTERHANTDSQ